MKVFDTLPGRIVALTTTPNEDTLFAIYERTGWRRWLFGPLGVRAYEGERLA